VEGIEIGSQKQDNSDLNNFVNNYNVEVRTKTKAYCILVSFLIAVIWLFHGMGEMNFSSGYFVLGFVMAFFTVVSWQSDVEFDELNSDKSVKYWYKANEK